MRSEVSRWLKSDFESIHIKLERYNLLEKNKGKSYLHVIKFHKYEEYDSEVGIIAYEHKSNSFEIKRDAHRNSYVDVSVVMEVLHTKEYLKIIADNFELPATMNAFNQFEVARQLLSTLPADRLNKIVIETMKARKVNNQFFNKVNSELNQVCLSMNLKKAERDKQMLNNMYQVDSY